MAAMTMTMLLFAPGVSAGAVPLTVKTTTKTA